MRPYHQDLIGREPFAGKDAPDLQPKRIQNISDGPSLSFSLEVQHRLSGRGSVSITLAAWTSPCVNSFGRESVPLSKPYVFFASFETRARTPRGLGRAHHPRRGIPLEALNSGQRNRHEGAETPVYMSHLPIRPTALRHDTAQILDATGLGTELEPCSFRSSSSLQLERCLIRICLVFAHQVSISSEPVVHDALLSGRTRLGAFTGARGVAISQRRYRTPSFSCRACLHCREDTASTSTRRTHARYR